MSKESTGGASRRCRVLVTGTVQGVYFRDSCRREAAAVGLAGWVRNLADGSVEAVFEGQPTGVEALLAWCATGPPRAVVRSVTVEELTPEGGSGFTVRS